MSPVVRMPPTEPLQPDGASAAGWWHTQGTSERIVCDLCPRACALKSGDRGFCFVRENRGGKMVLATYGRSTGFCVDPIEKKPLNHFYPGTSVLSFGTAGCNLGCKFCQNWSISKSREVATLSEWATPEMIADAARQLGCRSVAFTYNDPVIWAEYAMDVARACRAANVRTVGVTAGYITKAARGPFFSALDAANVDLKSFSETFYRRLTLSHLEPVLDTLQWLRAETDVWLEITNLIIPHANDSEDELQRMCEWVCDHLGDGVPLHFSAFHPDFRLRNRGPTPPEKLRQAHEIARQVGLKYVYVGNMDDQERQSTYCPQCGRLVVERNGYVLGAWHLDDNRCRHCGGTVAGRFDRLPGDWGGKRLPVRIARFAQQSSAIDIPKKGNPSMSSGPSEPADPAVRGAPPELTPDQQRAIHRGVCQLVAAAIAGDHPELGDQALAGAGGQTVLGCFVTIRRKGHLRGCCGFIDRATGLADAIVEAAVTTATRDMRLPSISPTELPLLNLRISLLHSLQHVRGSGKDRAARIEVGRHGLQIIRGSSRGLLLPSVATEYDLDAEEFLHQVCLKAGLPVTAWKEDDAQLITFETHTFGGPFDTSAVDPAVFKPPFLLGPEEASRLADACRANVVALTCGATPNFYIPGCPDGTVQGVAVRVHVPGWDHVPQIGQLSIRPGLPLQATLIDLARRAAHLLDAGFLSDDALGQVRLDLAVLHDPAVHGTVADPDLEGLDPRNRALLVTDSGRSAWIVDPERTPQELLATAARQARVQQPASAAVTSFQVVSTHIPMMVDNVPRPRSGRAVRPPAVAGTFYPAEPDELARLVDALWPKSPPASRRAWRGAMAPHAGLKYSGRLAAAVLDRIEPPSTVVVLGPKHTRLGVEWAIAPHETWSLPGDEIASDPALAAALAESIPGLELDAAAHAREHAIELQLPLLARLTPKPRVVGIVVGAGDMPRCQAFADGMARVLRARDDRTLLLISSDMNHFASDVETRRLDQIALAAVESLDPERLYETVRREHISMCGLLPAVIVLATLKKLGQLHTCERVGYTTSADATGELSRAVGYAGLLFN